MTYAALPKLKKNSVSTTIAAPGITDIATTIPVTETAYFYDADGTLILKGIVIGGDNANSILPEEITITGCSVAHGVGGPGNLTGVTRGVNTDDTIGAGHAWAAGTNICVTFSTGIYNQIKDNFTEMIQRNGTVAFTGAQSMGSNRLTSVGTPTTAGDAIPFQAWASWNPTLIWGTMDPASVSKVARWCQIGKTVFFVLQITSPDSNGCSSLSISLPVAHASIGMEVFTNGTEQAGPAGVTYTNPIGCIASGASTIGFYNFIAGVDGQLIYIKQSGFYEVA